MKPFILIAAVTYAIGVLAGFQIEPVLAESVDTRSFDFGDIARNNMTVVAINISGGLSMDVISILSTVYNGVILGYSVSIMVEHYSAALIARHFLPHSIEIIGIILSCASGLYLAYFIFKNLLGDFVQCFNRINDSRHAGHKYDSMGRFYIIFIILTKTEFEINIFKAFLISIFPTVILLIGKYFL